LPAVPTTIGIAYHRLFSLPRIFRKTGRDSNRPLALTRRCRCLPLISASVVLDTTSTRRSCWAGHAGCEPTQLLDALRAREIYHSHENRRDQRRRILCRASFIVSASNFRPPSHEGGTKSSRGEMPGMRLCSSAGPTLPIYAVSNPNGPRRALSQTDAAVRGHFAKSFCRRGSGSETRRGAYETCGEKRSAPPGRAHGSSTNLARTSKAPAPAAGTAVR